MLKSTLDGVGGQWHAPRALPPGKRQSTQCTWVDTKAVRTATENKAPTGIRFPDRPGRSESLYGLRYHRQNFTLLLPTDTSVFPIIPLILNKIHSSASNDR